MCGARSSCARTTPLDRQAGGVHPVAVLVQERTGRGRPPAYAAREPRARRGLALDGQLEGRRDGASVAGAPGRLYPGEFRAGGA